MSLDVSLTLPGAVAYARTDLIFIRENGQNKEISREEWDRRFPGQEPFTVAADYGDDVYSANITHNLARMAKEAMIYEALWRPEEIGITVAAQLIDPLTTGLALLRSDPTRFMALNPSNGWGDYDGLVDFVERYLAACQHYPNAEVSASR